MSQRIYALPVSQTGWRIPGHGAEVSFDWDYDEGRDNLLRLYETGKNKQWNATDRIDWSAEIDPGDRSRMPDEFIPIFGSPIWYKLPEAQRLEVRLHTLAWMFSQFLHGEQGALVCTAKIVETVPDLDAKFYGATQVMDEARHVEVYKRFLLEKVGLAYPINPHLAELLNQTITDSRWDWTYLGMQMMVEGVALGAFGMVRDLVADPLTKSVNAYVMSDEARHLAFGLMALQDVYPQLSDAERAEREDFAIEASYLLRDRFLAREVWERLDLPVEECTDHVRRSEAMALFRKQLFSRVVPNMKKIGLWGPKIQNAFVDMGVIDFQSVDTEALFQSDHAVADELDRLRTAKQEGRAAEIASTIAAGTS